VKDKPKQELSMLLIMSGKSCRKFELLTSIWVSRGMQKRKGKEYWKGGREEGGPRETRMMMA